MVGVIPVEAGVTEGHLIPERAAREHEILGHTRCAVVLIGYTNSVPMDRRWQIGLVCELDVELGVLWDIDEWPRVLAVEAVHHKRLAADRAENRSGFQLQR